MTSVGHSGCGKSTVLSMVQKLYRPTSGVIKLDGVDIRTIPTMSLREQIAVVPQEPKLFDMSVADNIAYRSLTQPDTTVTAVQRHPQHIESAPAVVDCMIRRASKTANAHTFVEELECGYEYSVGKFGGKLSGGQCQRVAIARSLYGHADKIKILLLDEATSALDTESELLVQEAGGMNAPATA